MRQLWQWIIANADNLKVASAAIGCFLLGARAARLIVATCATYLGRRTLRSRLEPQSYTEDNIISATSCYVVPDCQNVDPSGGEDWRRDLPVRQNAFNALDSILNTRSGQKYSLILADSGMGKSSLLLNYCARHWKSRKRSSQFTLLLIPLGNPNPERNINAVTDRKNTILFLDAFDEDTRAIQNHRARLAELVEATADFRHILITCRTQFFPKDEEIPTEIVGVLRSGPVAARESKGYYFHKLYLSPFSQDQVEHFIRMKFRFWSMKNRNRARVLAAQIQDLTVRPLLLSYIPDLLEMKGQFKYPFQIYEEMVSSWLQRERPLVDDKVARAFSEVLAIDLLVHRRERGAEKISSGELDDLLLKFHDKGSQTALKHSLEKWQIRSRSLLNRDASGNWKFAHRSILEYLAAISIINNSVKVPSLLLTDQTKKFIWEMNDASWRIGQGTKPVPLVPFVDIRSTPRRFSSVAATDGERKELLARQAHSSWPLSFEVSRMKLYEAELFKILRRAVAQSMQKEQVYDLTIALYHHVFLGEPHLTSIQFPPPSIGITDLATGLRWYISVNLQFDGASFFEGPRTEKGLREPTLPEALSLRSVLQSQPGILADMLELVNSLELRTADSAGEGEQIVVRYEFDGSKFKNESVACLPRDYSVSNGVLVSGSVEIAPQLIPTWATETWNVETGVLEVAAGQ